MQTAARLLVSTKLYVCVLPLMSCSIDEAIADFSQAIDTDPTCALSYNARGVLLQNTGELHQALQDFDTAVQLMPDNSTFYRYGSSSCILPRSQIISVPGVLELMVKLLR